VIVPFFISLGVVLIGTGVPARLANAPHSNQAMKAIFNSTSPKHNSTSNKQ
jgi:hypothetical protein